MSEPQHYINRELSWLEFNKRVLYQAFRQENPVLERVKFLAITNSNLDEFVSVRVGGLILVASSGSDSTSIDGLTAEQQLDKIRSQIREFNRLQSQCLEQIESELEQHGIVRLTADELSERQRESLHKFFLQEAVATLAPKAVTNRELGDENLNQFSHMRSARLHMCIRVRNQQNAWPISAGEDTEAASRYLTISLGGTLPRMVPVAGDGHQFILLEDVIEMFLADMLPGEEIEEVVSFRIMRNADVAVDEDDNADLLLGMQKMLVDRQLSGCVRLEISGGVSDTMLSFLTREIGVDPADIYRIDGPIDLSMLFGLSGIKGFNDLKDEPWPPQESPDFPPDQNVFDVIAAGDRLLYHPYQEYDPVVEFLYQAAEDPDVIAIKQTLYRTSRDSEIVRSLIQAVANGKHVTAVVELKARFDEARNIEWARKLELAGVDVIYGVSGLKTHCKVCLVVRREATGIQRYVHFGTGNYNEATARIYSDVSYFTCDEQLGMDAIHFLNAITGLSVPQTLGKLSAAPINLRDSFMDLIQFEIDNADGVIGGEITAKLNSLVDKKIIDALYRASQAGVKIRLNIRGICCLKPGVKGLSENIEVVSIVDRFLEHARIFRFKHNGENRIFISSADWMNRNLDRRVELLIPVLDSDCRTRLGEILDCYFRDNVVAQELTSDGSFRAVPRKKGDSPFRAQRFLYDRACELLAARTNPRTTIFKPHRGESA